MLKAEDKKTVSLKVNLKSKVIGVKKQLEDSSKNYNSKTKQKHTK